MLVTAVLTPTCDGGPSAVGHHCPATQARRAVSSLGLRACWLQGLRLKTRIISKVTE